MSRDIHAASHALRDASHYLAMAWMKELQAEASGTKFDETCWPMDTAIRRIKEAANCLGFTMTPAAAPVETPAPCAEYNEEAADVA